MQKFERFYEGVIELFSQPICSETPLLCVAQKYAKVNLALALFRTVFVEQKRQYYWQ